MYHVSDFTKNAYRVHEVAKILGNTIPEAITKQAIKDLDKA